MTILVVASCVGVSSPATSRGFRPPAAPRRLLDTREGTATVDGQFVAIGARPAGSTLALQVAGRADVPADAASAVLSVTVDRARDDGYVTVYPCDAPRPNASNLNYTAGITRANAVLTGLDGRGQACLYTFGSTDLIVDVSAVLYPGEFDTLHAPQRLLDSRPGGPTADGQFSGIGVRAAGSTVQLDVAGRAGMPVGATTVALNVTVDRAREDGYVTAHSCDTPTPNASSLNYSTGDTVANLVISRVDAKGRVCLYTFGATDMIVDVAGVMTAYAFAPLDAPRRLLDSRPGAATFDGQYAGNGIRPAHGTLELPITGRAGITFTAAAVALNITVDSAETAGFLTAYPAGMTRPNASNLNYLADRPVAVTVITRLGPNGTVCLHNYAATHVIVDIVGVLTASPQFDPTGGCRGVLEVLDTIPVTGEQPAGYGPALFPHWSDLDRDGCDTRAEVLQAESSTRVQVGSDGCTVTEGSWYSPYDEVHASNPSDLDIDHVVALKEAWDSGANAWTTARREAFANDLTDDRTLIAVTDNVLQSKGDADPSDWLPPPYVCKYLSDWVAIKARWALSIDELEAGTIRGEITARCPNQPIAEWPPAPDDIAGQDDNSFG